MTLKTARVVVTGAGGFIGSHLAERLAADGGSVRAFVHYRSDGSWGWLDRSLMKPHLEVVAGDIRDRDAVVRAVQGADIVFHLASLIGIPYSYDAVGSYLQTNVEGTWNVLQACRESDVQRLVHTSTSEVYGTARYVPIDERHPLQAQSPYAATKIAADKLAESFRHSYGTPVVTIRPFNTFGPRQSARAIIPAILSQALAGGPVRLGNLNATRDFSFVANTVDALVMAGRSNEVEGLTFNAGTGREVSIGELVGMVGHLLGRTLDVEVCADRLRPEESEVERLAADSSLAETVLGWRPAVSLEEGLATTLEWMRDHLKDYRAGHYAV